MRRVTPCDSDSIAYFVLGRVSKMADRSLGFSRVLQTTGASMGLACASRLGNAIDLIETTYFQGRRTFISKSLLYDPSE